MFWGNFKTVILNKHTEGMNFQALSWLKDADFFSQVDKV